jgi:hypothetical protein
MEAECSVSRNCHYWPAWLSCRYTDREGNRGTNRAGNAIDDAPGTPDEALRPLANFTAVADQNSI